ncbi:Protein TolB [anaerobic digester metagenome]
MVDNKVFLYFDGNYLHLEEQIRSGIARVILNQMIYGEQISANIKNSTLMALPEWYLSGLQSYLASDWNTELDEKMRDAVVSGKFRKFNHLEGADATLAGHSVWRFIAGKYGGNMIPNIIYMAKVSRNVENGFLYVLGISFKNLIREWYTYNLTIYQNDIDGRDKAPEHNVPVKIKRKNFYYQAKASPDGRYLTYVMDKVNKKKLFIVDRQSGKKKKLFRLGTKMDDTPDMTYPLAAWDPTSGLFAWEVENKGRRKLYLYNVNDKTREEFFIDNMNKVLDMAYSPDGSMLVMSAVINGYSDIFLFYTGSKSFTRITNDIYDDLQPRFIDNGRMIAFASNRVSDTLVLEQETYMIDYSEPVIKQQSFDIFAYDVVSKQQVLRRVTNTPAVSESSPMPWDGKYFSFLSDQNGICNQQTAYFDSAIAYVDTSVHYRYFTMVSPVTNFSSAIREQESYLNSDLVTQVFTVGKSSRIIVSEKDNPNAFSSVVKPMNTSFADERNLRFSIMQIIPDTTRQNKSGNKQGFVTSQKDSGNVNIYNYRFSTNTNKNPKKNTPAKTDSIEKFVLPHQQNYDVEYGIEKLVSQLDFSFLNTTYQPYNRSVVTFSNAGNNALFQMSVSDLLEDKRISGVVRSSFSLDNNEYFISYEDLARRLDRQVVFHRLTYDAADENSYIKHHLHDANYIFKWPFSPVLALKGTLIFKYDNQVYKSIDDISLATPDVNTYWGGTRIELIFDNTRPVMTNIMYGLRYKLFAEYYQGINKSELNLITAGFDFRHYSKIHRTFIWANRVAFGTSFGSTRLLYYLGGTDNTFLPSFNTKQAVDTTMNFAFQTLGTNLRGFPQNIRNGNTFAVINTELRFPVFRYLLNRPIKSQFINNFQIVGFGDIGSAWLGLNPYSDENIMVPETFYQKPITVVVKTPRNPLVGGMGLGLRTTVFGYFLRFDVAWGIEELHVYSPRYVLSFSLDF